MNPNLVVSPLGIKGVSFMQPHLNFIVRPPVSVDYAKVPVKLSATTLGKGVIAIVSMGLMAMFPLV